MPERSLLVEISVAGNADLVVRILINGIHIKCVSNRVHPYATERLKPFQWKTVIHVYTKKFRDRLFWKALTCVSRRCCGQDSCGRTAIQNHFIDSGGRRIKPDHQKLRAILQWKFFPSPTH